MNEFVSRAIGVPWIDRGRDFSGWDCWGMVVCFYRDVFNIDLNKYEDISCENIIESIRTTLSEVQRWVKIPQGKEKYGDVGLWRSLHSGIVLTNNKMLHCYTGVDTCIERYNNSIWKPRLMGFYRHAKLI